LKEQQDCRVRKCIGNDNHRYIYFPGIPKTGGQRSYEECRNAFADTKAFGEQVLREEGDKFKWTYPFKDDLLYCHMMDQWGNSNKQYRDLRLAKQQQRGDDVYTYPSRSEEGGSRPKKRKRVNIDVARSIVDAEEISLAEYERLTKGGGDETKNHDCEIKQFQIRDFLSCTRRALDVARVRTFTNEPADYIARCRRLGAYCKSYHRGEKCTIPKNDPHEFETEIAQKHSAWRQFQVFSSLIGELFGLKQSFHDQDQAYPITKALHQKDKFYFGPRQSGEAEVDPADKPLATALEVSGVVDKSEWMKRAREVVRLVTGSTEVHVPPSRATVKKETTTTFMDCFVRLCGEIFPKEVLCCHEAVPLLTKKRVSNKAGNKTTWRYQYSWNQDAVEAVRGLLRQRQDPHTTR
jgi:hypothetical protein